MVCLIQNPDPKWRVTSHASRWRHGPRRAVPVSAALAPDPSRVPAAKAPRRWADRARRHPAVTLWEVVAPMIVIGPVSHPRIAIPSSPLDRRALVAWCWRPGGRGGERKAVSTCAHLMARGPLARSAFDSTAPCASVNPRPRHGACKTATAAPTPLRHKRPTPQSPPFNPRGVGTGVLHGVPASGLHACTPCSLPPSSR
jgi:hypothetical protein